MQLSDAAEIMRQLQAAAGDIGFKPTTVSYDIFRAFWNADVLNRRGVYVCGVSGIGKTMTFEAIERWERMRKKPFPVLNINVRSIEDRYRADGQEFLKELVEYPRVVFHNFGFENEAIPDYGSKRNVLLDVLDQRYDRYQRGKYTRTYITTNYNQKKVQSYGIIVYRRIVEMMDYYEVSNK